MPPTPTPTTAWNSAGLGRPVCYYFFCLGAFIVFHTVLLILPSFASVPASQLTLLSVLPTRKCGALIPQAHFLVLSRVSVAVIKHHGSRTWEGGGLRGFILSYTSRKQTTSEGTQAKVMEGLLTRLAPDGLFILPYTTQDHIPRGSTTQNRLEPPALIINQENAL